jgi:uncharacterized protein (UPF0128 family)
MPTDSPVPEDQIPRYKTRDVCRVLGGIHPETFRRHVHAGTFGDVRKRGTVYRFTWLEVRAMFEIWTTRG